MPFLSGSFDFHHLGGEPGAKSPLDENFFCRLMHEAPEEEGGSMKIASGITIATLLLLVGFAAGFPVGKSVGFTTGSEWALVQADILAREAGVFMPVRLYDDNFRIVIKQPRGLHKRVWHLADRYDDQAEALYKVSALRKVK